MVTMESEWETVRTQTFEWYQFEWPWVTSNPDYIKELKNSIRQSYTYNSKSYMMYSMASFSVALNDL